ncbi:hypothetical protein BD779DRAFT_1539317 [Infundibulicybe gibba]|nr:hypothetical protein BD779DRAFT_1539317 [Infundibulicybe gibba]
MAGGMQIDVAELAGIAAEGVLYGIFLVLDIAALYILVRRRDYHRRINKPMVVAAITMFLLSTAQFVVDTTTVFVGFIAISDRPHRLAYLNDLSEPIFAARHAIYFAMMIVGDAIVIYRCYVVWGHCWKVVLFPILCSLASAACAFQTIWAIRHDGFDAQLELNMGFPIFSLSFGANAVATTLIAYKICMAHQQLKKTMSTAPYRGSLMPTARIIIESGAINTAYLLVYTIVLHNGTNGVQILASIVTPFVGIIFTMVIIRATLVADRKAADSAAMSQNHQMKPRPATIQPITPQGASVLWISTTDNISTEKITVA